MGRKLKAIAMTRQHLITAFLQSYRSLSIEKITIQSICTTAGYNRSTFYKYFTDIYDLLQQTEDELISEILSDLKLSENATSEKMINKLADIYENYGERLSIFLGSTGDPSFFTNYKAALRPIVSAFYKFDCDDLYSGIVFEYVINGIISSFSFWFEHKDILDSKQFSKIIQELIFNGIQQYIPPSSSV